MPSAEMKWQPTTGPDFDSAGFRRQASDLGPPVILSGTGASLREATVESKDPYERHNFLLKGLSQGNPTRVAFVDSVGVLRLRIPIRERIGLLRSGLTGYELGEPTSDG
jgi:hypothetical protein